MTSLACKRWDSVLAFQATLEVQPADKLLSHALRISLMIGSLGVQGSKCEEAINLVRGKASLFKLLHFCRCWVILFGCHGWPPFSQSSRERTSRPTVLTCRLISYTRS